MFKNLVIAVTGAVLALSANGIVGTVTHNARVEACLTQASTLSLTPASASELRACRFAS